MVGVIARSWGGWLTQGRAEMLQSTGLLALRVGVGTLMVSLHAWEKVLNFSELRHGFHDPLDIGSQNSLMLAIFAEFACSIFVFLGVFTRLACIPLITTMAVAAFVVHGADWQAPPGPDGFGPEMALLYLSAYVALLFCGPGKISVDALIMQKPAGKS